MQMKTSNDKTLPGCNVSTAFNMTVGALSVIAAAAIVYLVWQYW